MSVHGFDDRLARERRARLQAERLLAQRSEDLYKANKKLSEHAHALSHQVIEQREENAVLVGRSSQAQAALQVATEKADIAERRLWDSLTAVEDGFAIFDSDWRLVMANPAWIKAFDGASDVAPGAHFDAILRIAVEEGLVDLEGEDGTAWTRRMIARWQAPKIAQTDLKLWNGGYVRLLDKRTPEGDIVSIAVDITGTIRRQRQLARARDAAEAAARAKSNFLANMSHEIRTPMNGVVSMADMLRETELDEEQRMFADTIRSSGEALLVIINDVLDYSKIEAEKLTLHCESFNLEALIHEIMRLLRPGLQGKDIDLRVDYDLFLPDRMVGDPGRIRQILTNLIGNAVKFTEKGHITVHVFGELGDHPDARLPLRVVVEDTGVGIPKEKQDHVFGEFNQVEDEANRRHDGTGLGLAITKRLIRMMNGEMWLTSEPGEGSAFGFSIVLDHDPAVASEPVPPLPIGQRAVHLVTGGQDMPDALLAQLCRLRAEVTETSEIPDRDVLTDCAAIILRGPVDQAVPTGFDGAVLIHNDQCDDPMSAGRCIGPRTNLKLLRKLLVTRPTLDPPEGKDGSDAPCADRASSAATQERKEGDRAPVQNAEDGAGTGNAPTKQDQAETPDQEAIEKHEPPSTSTAGTTDAVGARAVAADTSAATPEADQTPPVNSRTPAVATSEQPPASAPDAGPPANIGPGIISFTSSRAARRGETKEDAETGTPAQHNPGDAIETSDNSGSAPDPAKPAVEDMPEPAPCAAGSQRADSGRSATDENRQPDAGEAQVIAAAGREPSAPSLDKASEPHLEDSETSRADVVQTVESSSDPDAGDGPKTGTNPPAAAPRRKLRLLAAEDNKTNQLVFRTMLKKLDIELKLVENGRQLVDAWADSAPDVIFTDISMPEMDGIAAAMEIRAQEASGGRSRVPMVAMTAHAMAEDEKRIRAAGIDDYLTKPLKKDSLFGLIRVHCPENVDPFTTA